MPPSSQALYFHLGLNADDDGVVEAHTIMRLTDSKEDDYKVLMAKEFIVELNKDRVVVIRDWNEHNLIRADRKINSIYTHLLKEVLPEIKLVEPRKRADRQGTSQGQPQDRIGKVRLGKDSIEDTAPKNGAERQKKKLRKTKTAKDNGPMTRDEFVETCRKSPQRHIKIIAEYADEKKIKYTTKDQWRVFLNRNLRSARQLVPFTDQQLAEAMTKIEKADYIKRWTLETLLKYLEE